MRRVLEHEQIHFALIEIGARQLDRPAEHLVRDLEITAPSRSQAEAAAQAHVEAIVELALVHAAGASRPLRQGGPQSSSA
ncbi:MAG: hypothetical protein CME13_20930 [Gemmatimonadetes bacterium]|jgi:hypothetical protein|nr:hypothetical protein [Gemmatimonadota bacterium]HCV23448.1 hypothetical protein [Candidatus Latescibacterota bacterium]